MDDILKNKWVWIGGASVVALLFFMNSGSSSASGSSSNYLSAVTALNQQSADNVTAQMQIAANAGVAQSQTDASIVSAALGAVENLSQTNALVVAQAGQSQAGVASSIATSAMAANTQGLVAGAGAVESVAAASASMTNVRTNAIAQQNIAKTTANANLWSNIAGDVTGIAKTAIPVL